MTGVQTCALPIFPVVATRRTAYDDGGQPFRLTLSVYPADRNQFVVKVGNVPADPARVPVDVTEDGSR